MGRYSGDQDDQQSRMRKGSGAIQPSFDTVAPGTQPTLKDILLPALLELIADDLDYTGRSSN